MVVTGISTFALPDLRGRTSIHAGTGPGLTPRQLGSSFGTEGVTLSIAQIPAHKHAGATITDTGGSQAHMNMQPSLVLNHIIALDGTYPSGSGGGLSEDFMGEISLFAGTFAPRGWAFADGQLLDIAGHTALYSLLGTTYGGDGISTFALPDLRGRTSIYAGTGPGLTPRQLGSSFGAEDVTLSIAQMPAHKHLLPEPGTLALLAVGGLAMLIRPKRWWYQ